MDGVIHDSVVSLSVPAAVNSELLCFIADRCHILSVDDLVKICSDFYAEDEIVAARDLIHSLFSKSDGPHLPKHTRQAKRTKHVPPWMTLLKLFSILMCSYHSSMLSISLSFHL